jgi:capsular exopolysaccharide synthesis family protein
MSRVDEAMRRAGAGVDETDADRTADAPEPYPIEMPDRHATPDDQPHLLPVPTPPPQQGSHQKRVVEEPAPKRLFDRFHQHVTEKIVVDRRMPAACREQYRRLAAILHDAQAANRTQVVLVTSALAGEGKTLTAANLALTLSSSYRRRVLVIDGDLRRPVMDRIFRVDAACGLADGLDPSTDMKIVVRQITSLLALLPAGRPTADPMAGLISDRMRRLIEEARGTFDWVIIDTPPLVLLPDAHLLASIADAAVLVVRAESTPHAMVKRAMEAIGRSRVLGVVLNGTLVAPHGTYGGYGEYQYGPSAVGSP